MHGVAFQPTVIQMTLVNLGWSQYAQEIDMDMRDRFVQREVAEAGETWKVRVASMQDIHI